MSGDLPRVVAEFEVDGHEVRNLAGQTLSASSSGALRVEFTYGEWEEAVRILDLLADKVRRKIMSTAPDHR